MKKLLLMMFFMAFVSVGAYSQSEADDEVYKIVEEMPQFPGGAAKMMEYVQQNLIYPEEARANNVQGRVFVNFIIERDGTISNVEVKRGIGSGCDEEAVRLVKLMPKWTPGKQRGNAVRCSYMLPVVFKP